MFAFVKHLPILVLALWKVPCTCHAAEPSSEQRQDLVVLGYNSYDARSESLLFASVDENDKNVDLAGSDSNFSTVNAGMGAHLWTIDQSGPELMRGWMFRLRLTIQAVMDEYNRRGKQDFIAVVSDATDVYVSRNLDSNALQVLKERFLNEFAEHQIVFSTQIYCCNPWELRSIGRADWDRFYGKNAAPGSMYKHLNAGLYMGYASAIMEMAGEMQLWDKDYHRHEGFHSLVGTDAAKDLRMQDMEVDDDEWQLSAWFFQDQAKEKPMSTLDTNQVLFAVTGTFRAVQKNDGYKIYSRDHFRRMFGPFPSSFSFEHDMEELSVCPYEYDTDRKQWSNKLTHGSPLVFHFAGNDWLCACRVFKQEGFQGITGKFRKNCQNEMDRWFTRVDEGIVAVARDENVEADLFLPDLQEVSVASGKLRRLGNNGNPHRGLDENHGPYRRGLDELYTRSLDEIHNPYRRGLDENHDHYRRGLDDPYRRGLVEGNDLEENDDPYRRGLGDDGPYRHDRSYRRGLGDDGPYRRGLGDDGPYSREDGPYSRGLEHDEAYSRDLGEDGPYRRALDDGPYSTR